MKIITKNNISKKETTFTALSRQIDNIRENIITMQEAGDYTSIRELEGRLGGIKYDLEKMLWIELPELNDIEKYKALSHSSTGIRFSAGVFEQDGMRQAFFKRQAKKFFKTEQEQQAYMAHAEQEYLDATVTAREMFLEVRRDHQNKSPQERKVILITKFEESQGV